MSESSEDNKENKETIEPVTVKVEESEESSSSIRKDDDDDVYFPSNTDDIQKLNFISNTTSSKPINNNIGALGPDHMYLKIYFVQIHFKNRIAKKLVKHYPLAGEVIEALL